MTITQITQKKKYIEMYTDGSFIKNKDGVKCGYGVYFPNKEYETISKKFTHEPLTNQRAELYAILKGLLQIYKSNKYENIIVYTDSMYSINSMTIWIKQWKQNGWKTAGNKPVLNQDIIMKLDKVLTMHKGEILFEHVKAHTSLKDKHSINNDIVDKLAKCGANS